MYDRTTMLCTRDGGFWIGTPSAASRYVQSRANNQSEWGSGGYGGNASNPYSVPRNKRNTMETQPSRFYAPPMGAQHTFPDMLSLNALWFTGIDGGIPLLASVGNRAAVTVHTPDGGQPTGLRMNIVSPMKYNQQYRVRRTGKDIRLQPGTVRPSRRFIMGIPVGS